jgi:predicted Zn-dependent protease
LVYQYAEALITAKQETKAEGFLRDQVVLYRQDARLQNLLAKVYAAQGKQALQHIALAEAYAIQVNWKAAMQQLELARREKDAQYYELSVIDAREREWKEAHKDELTEKNKK